MPATTGYTPGPVPCQPNSFPAPLDYAGMNGTVCAVSIHPATFNITQCCRSAVRVVDDCTQYCETKNQGNQAVDSNMFSNCVQAGNNGTFVSSMCGEYMNGTGVNASSPEAQTNTGSSLGSSLGLSSAGGLVVSLTLLAVGFQGLWM